MTVLYLSGPMSGLPNYNFPAFADHAFRLRRAGFVVLNPAENWGGSTDIPRAQCMRLDIQQVLLSDGVALIDGWRESPGARCEIDVAHSIEIRVQSVDRWLDEVPA